MGFNDLIRKANDYIEKDRERKREIAQKNFERKREVAQKNFERAQLTKVQLYISSGQQQIKTNAITLMFQKPTGEIFFGVNENNLYELIDYSWNGPQYNTVTNSVKTGTHIKKGKSGKIGVGAVVGTVVAGPVGTAVGAAMGAGSKGTTNIRENTQSISNQVEINTPATLKFRNITTGENASIVIACNSLIDSQIKCFTLANSTENYINTPQLETAANQSGIDVVEEIRRFKELADSGIITQEEFELKKKQLLNL